MAKISMTLNSGSINGVIQRLNEYKDSLQSRSEQFVSALADKGIIVAEQVKGKPGRFGTHQMENFVTFSKELDPQKYGCHGVMVGIGKTIYAEWFSPDGKEKRNGSINSLLSIEFGTAGLAIAPNPSFGGVGGQGSNSKYGHTNDVEWYFAVDYDSEKDRPIWKYATAITPTRPMFNAANEMRNEIRKTATEIFRL